NLTSGQQGQTVDVALTGAFTSWVQGTTTASFGAGINLVGVTVTSPTTATARIAITAAATLGARDVTVTTGGQVVLLSTAFTVLAGTPVLASINPTSGQQGQTVDVALTGAFTSWVQGTTTASFGSGINLVSVTVTSPTTATARIAIAAAATLGARDV